MDEFHELAEEFCKINGQLCEHLSIKEITEIMRKISSNSRTATEYSPLPDVIKITEKTHELFKEILRFLLVKDRIKPDYFERTIFRIEEVLKNIRKNKRIT